MHRRLLGLALIALPALAADDDAALRKDLASVIALRGHACEAVTKVEKKGENDFIATCRDGKRYRVQLSGERVVVTRQ
jgi:hypothetical protein